MLSGFYCVGVMRELRFFAVALIIAALAGIAGSAKVGDFAMIGGQVGISGHIAVGNGAKIIAQSGVMHDLPPGGTYGGSPAIPAREWHRQTVTVAKMSQKTTSDE